MCAMPGAKPGGIRPDLEFLEVEDLLSPRTFGAETALIAVKDRRTGRSKIYRYAVDQTA